MSDGAMKEHEGLELGGTVAISTNGCIQGKENRNYFKKGLKEMIAVLKPKTIINYSYTLDNIFLPYKKVGIKIIEIENYINTVRKKANS